MTDGSGPPKAGREPRPPRRSGARNSATWSTSRAARNEPSTSEPPSTITLDIPRAPRAARAASRRDPPAEERTSRTSTPASSSRRRRDAGAPGGEDEDRGRAAEPSGRGGSPGGRRRRLSRTTRVNGRRVRGDGRRSGSSARTVPMPTRTRVVEPPQPPRLPPLGGAGDPLRVARGGGDPPVQGLRRLEQDEGASRAGGDEEALVEPRRLPRQDPGGDLHPGATQQGQAAAAHPRVRVAQRGHDPGDPRVADQRRARAASARGGRRARGSRRGWPPAPGVPAAPRASTSAWGPPARRWIPLPHHPASPNHEAAHDRDSGSSPPVPGRPAPAPGA